jgi:hypothetical protein
MTSPSGSSESTQPLESPEEGYDGPAVLDVEGRRVPVVVVLRGGFQPIDGRYHLYGRARSSECAIGQSGSEVEIRTPTGVAVGRLSDLDPWGRFRISGEGRPPFETDLRRTAT